MKLIKTEDAVGCVLCHDITQIIPGVVKDAVFRKGHVVTREDIPVLLSVGKEHLYVWEKQEGMLHEDEAAEILRSVCQNAQMDASKPKEGKIELTAQCDGVLKVDKEKLCRINAMGQMCISSRHGNFPVKNGDKIAGMRVIPLVIEEEKMKQVKEIAGETPVFALLPFQKKKAAIVTTGSEVYHGRIQDKFTPVVRQKLEEYGVEVLASNMRLQYKGIGRAMKIGKEGTMGLLQAIKEYLAGEHVCAVTKSDLEQFAAKVNEIDGCKAVLIQDEAGREIYRAKISFDKNAYGFSAKEMIGKLQEGAAAVYTRDYQANIGSLAIDPRPLKNLDELEYIYRRIVEIGKEK